jgi:hypothetical protein
MPMKKQFLTLFTFMISLMSMNVLYGQEDPRGLRSSAVPILECVDIDYGFLIESDFYKQNSNVYICKDMIPLDIQFVDSNKVAVTNGSITWKINSIPIPSNQEAWKATLFQNEVVYLSKSYILNVSDDVDIRPQDGFIDHGFDDNKIAQYWPSATSPPNTPRLFARPNTNASVRLMATNKAGKQLVKDKGYKYAKVKSSSTSITIAPTKFTAPHHAFNVTNGGVLADSIYLHGCNGIKRVFLFTKASNVITVPIKYIRIAETDDDEINYCPADNSQLKGCAQKIDSVNHKCILEGSDGSYEEESRMNYLVTHGYNKIFFPTWVDKKDSIIIKEINGIKKPIIIAGVDKVCNTVPIPRDTFYDPLGAPSTLQTMGFYANKIYNQYALI